MRAEYQSCALPLVSRRRFHHVRPLRPHAADDLVASATAAFGGLVRRPYQTVVYVAERLRRAGVPNPEGAALSIDDRQRSTALSTRAAVSLVHAEGVDDVQRAGPPSRQSG